MKNIRFASLYGENEEEKTRYGRWKNITKEPSRKTEGKPHAMQIQSQFNFHVRTLSMGARQEKSGYFEEGFTTDFHC